MAPRGHQWVTERVQGPLPTTGGHQGEEAGERWTEEIIWSVSALMSHLVGKPTMWFSTRSDINRPVQLQKQTRSLKFWS